MIVDKFVDVKLLWADIQFKRADNLNLGVTNPQP